MEWIELAGSTPEEAVRLALEEFGVERSDIEYEIVQEARSGILGIGKTEAIVRARIKPQAPRAKEQGKSRSRRTSRSDSDAPADQNVKRPSRERKKSETSTMSQQKEEFESNTKEAVSRMEEEVEVDLEVQGDEALAFIEGFFRTVNLQSEVTLEIDDEEDVAFLTIEGKDLGHLIGQRGSTLHAIQELTRSVVHRKTGAYRPKIVIDISGYREKRRSALSDFVRQLATEVLETKEERVLEPMNPADRKIVHDTINEIDGVATVSQGESRSRHVKIFIDDNK